MTKKILFNDRFLLTKAVLDGRKTQTRRVITCPKTFHGKDVYGYYVCRRATDGAITEVCMYDEDESFIDEGQILPKYKVGEIVAIAQNYKDLGYVEISLDISTKDYRISRGTLGKSKGWNNKMFVRAEACKHQIRITNVHVEQLQNISDEDCLKEGIEEFPTKSTLSGKAYTFNGINESYKTPQEAFAYLINKVNRKDVWKENPYVFVYDFELVK